MSVFSRFAKGITILLPLLLFQNCGRSFQSQSNADSLMTAMNGENDQPSTPAPIADPDSVTPVEPSPAPSPVVPPPPSPVPPPVPVARARLITSRGVHCMAALDGSYRCWKAGLRGELLTLALPPGMKSLATIGTNLSEMLILNDKGDLYLGSGLLRTDVKDISGSAQARCVLTIAGTFDCTSAQGERSFRWPEGSPTTASKVTAGSLGIGVESMGTYYHFEMDMRDFGLKRTRQFSTAPYLSIHPSYQIDYAVSNDAKGTVSRIAATGISKMGELGAPPFARIAHGFGYLCALPVHAGLGAQPKCVGKILGERITSKIADVQMETIAFPPDVVDISSSYYSFCILRKSGSVTCWGYLDDAKPLEIF